MDFDTIVNVSFGIIILATAAVFTYELLVYIDLQKRSEYSWKLVLLITITALLILVELIFGIWHFAIPHTD